MGIKAVILCGGQGTRIREASEAMPKPMLPIGGKPIVWHIMKMYAAHGITEFVLCLGYKSWVIKEFFLNYRAMTNDITLTLGKNHAVEVSGSAEENWKIVLAETGEDTMTGGRVAAVRKYVENDELFCLTYGDGLADIDIKALLEFHKAEGREATLTAVHPPARFGATELDGGRVVRFAEKPQGGHAAASAEGGWINGGFFVCEHRVLGRIAGDDTIWERAPLEGLARDGQLSAFRHHGFWQPMDTLREKTLLEELWASGQAPWKLWA